MCSYYDKSTKGRSRRRTGVTETMMAAFYSSEAVSPDSVTINQPTTNCVLYIFAFVAAFQNVHYEKGLSSSTLITLSVMGSECICLDFASTY